MAHHMRTTTISSDILGRKSKAPAGGLGLSASRSVAGGLGSTSSTSTTGVGSALGRRGSIDAIQQSAAEHVAGKNLSYNLRHLHLFNLINPELLPLNTDSLPWVCGLASFS